MLGPVGAPTSRRAVAVALEEGITHFDVARSYGYGEAERLLGDCVRGCRHNIVIASKFGIVATGASRVLRPLKPIVRLVKQQYRQTSALSRKLVSSRNIGLPCFPSNIFLKSVKLDAIALKRSVETSLRELKTDYLDYIFLHEPSGPITQVDCLFECSLRLKQEGKIRAWGLAFMQKQADWHINYLPRFDILQMDYSPEITSHLDLVQRRRELPIVFFSPFRNSSVTQTNFSEILFRVHADFPRSVLLISMFREEHIRKNARALF
jgi:aryl-alcohol dehydrogenase-like predicted oxidoreductase